MTRREITENRIISNILVHNDPKDSQSFDNLYISTRSASSDPMGLATMHSHGALHPNMSLSQISKPGHPNSSTLQPAYQSATGLSLFNQQRSSAPRSKRNHLTNNSLPKIAKGASRNAASLVQSTNNIIPTNHYNSINMPSKMLHGNILGASNQ